MSVGSNQMRVHGTETVDMPMAVQPDHYDGRALFKLHMAHYKSRAELWWDDELVKEFSFGKKFIVGMSRCSAWACCMTSTCTRPTPGHT